MDREKAATYIHARGRVPQLPMPGMPQPLDAYERATPFNVLPGQEVIYLGSVAGGPRYGARGAITEVLHRTAVVDMGPAGNWHIPYYLLAVPRAVRRAA